jgi:hypothetical protein
VVAGFLGGGVGVTVGHGLGTRDGTRREAHRLFWLLCHAAVVSSGAGATAG